MAGSIYIWSTTASANGSSDGDINFVEGQAPSTLNNSNRQVMGRIAEFVKDIGGTITATGTANAILATINSNVTAYANGLMFSFIAAADNTGAATLNVNSVGAKSIRKMDSTGDVALAGAEIQVGGVYDVRYNSAVDAGSGGWILMNPTLSAAVYALSSLATTNNAVARYDGTSGGLQNSGVIIDDSNNVSGVRDLDASGTVFASTAGGFKFRTDTDTGMATGTVDEVQFYCGGVKRGEFNAGGLEVVGGMVTSGNIVTQAVSATSVDASGTVLASSAGGFKFRTDTNTGMASSAASRIDFFCNGGLASSMLSNGDFVVSGNITANSDENLKTNWQDIPANYVDLLAGVKAGTYDRIDIEMRQAGVGAQSFRPVLPTAVLEGDDGTLSLAYGQAALVSSVALARRLLALEERLSK